MRTSITALSASLMLAITAVVGATTASAAPPASTPTAEIASSHLPALVATGTYYAGSQMSSEIQSYRASGRYTGEQETVAKSARKFLDSYLTRACSTHSCKAAISFDFDDTLVSWYDVMNAGGFQSNPALTGPAMDNCTTPVIAPVLALLKHAQAKGVAVYVITGRPESSRAVTQACMDKVGIGKATLVLRQPHQAHLTAKAYKSSERAKIEKSGKRVVVSIGDQVSDVSGGHTLSTFVLPNPMYFIA